jgi:hypothetical protein
MTNPFLTELDTYFNRIVELQFSLFQISTVLKRDFKKHQERSDNKTNNQFKAGSRLGIRDLSGETDNGWEINFSTDYTKFIKSSEYGNEIENFIAREAGYTIAQACEAFVRYLKDVVALQLFHFEEKAIQTSQKFSKCKTKEDYKRQLREIRKLRSPKLLFQILKQSSPEFKEMNKKNNLNIELTSFYEVLAFVRHKVTHSSSRFKRSAKEDWSREKNNIFNNYYSTIPIENELLIKMKRLRAQRVIKRTAELGFGIFKSLSLCNSYEWDIIKV